MPKENSMKIYRNVAQRITVGAAIATGIVWIIESIAQASDTSWLMGLQTILVAVTVVGGVIMGVLYLVSKLH